MYLYSNLCQNFVFRKMPPKRKYDDDYIKLGFTSIEINGEIRPQCILCATVLSNDALKPAKLERHLKSMHPKYCDRSREFFEGKLTNFKKMKLGPSGTSYAASEKTLSVSFEVSKLITKSKKSAHNRRIFDKALYAQSCRRAFRRGSSKENS